MSPYYSNPFKRPIPVVIGSRLEQDIYCRYASSVEPIFDCFLVNWSFVGRQAWVANKSKRGFATWNGSLLVQDAHIRDSFLVLFV